MIEKAGPPITAVVVFQNRAEYCRRERFHRHLAAMVENTRILYPYLGLNRARYGDSIPMDHCSGYSRAVAAPGDIVGDAGVNWIPQEAV